MVRFRDALDNMFFASGCGAVVWEVARRERGVHTHWQVVPVERGLLEDVDTVFREAARKENLGGFTDERGEEGGEWGAVGSYFRLWVSPRRKDEADGGVRLGGGESEEQHGEGEATRGRWIYLPINEAEYFDLQFGRRVLAGLIPGLDNRVSWKDVQQSQEEEVNDTTSFKQALGKWDFAAE